MNRSGVKGGEGHRDSWEAKEKEVDPGHQGRVGRGGPKVIQEPRSKEIRRGAPLYRAGDISKTVVGVDASSQKKRKHSHAH